MDPLRSSLEKAVDGRHRIVRELGRGGMGAVFLAEDLALDREVAIKVLPPELAVQPVLRERFVREAKLAASLSHPNIVHVHSVEEHGDAIAIVMQFVDGETLTERIARSGPYDAPDLARLLQDTAWALGYAHGKGVVHRDVKPDNLMIERGTGRALIMDFGIARQERASNLTEVGHSIGTPSYMSPEQAAAEKVDGRSDLYSLGCVAFFAATGRPPFEAESAHKVLMKHMTEAPPLISALREGIPDGLVGTIDRCLSKDPGERFPNGEAVAEAISALQLRTREVAPLLRLFNQQTAQSIQALAMLLVIFTIFWQIVPAGDEAFRAMVAVLFGTMSITIVSQVLDRVRFAVRQGFTVADVEAAFESIGDETTRAREQLLADPVERARIKRRKRFAMLGGFLGGVSGPVALNLFSSMDHEGIRQIQPTGALILLAGTIAAGVAIAFWAMRPVRVTLAQRLAGKFWGSRLGRAIFARAERRYLRERVHQQM